MHVGDQVLAQLGELIRNRLPPGGLGSRISGDRFALIATQANARMTAMLGRYESCSDGMSDFDYGWRIDLLVEDGAKPAYAYEGCCHLPVAK